MVLHGMLGAVTGIGTAAAAGALAGVGIAVPVGAVGAVIVLLGARHGWRTGCAAGLGAAVVDGAYATVAVVAGAALAPALERAAEPVRWVSAAVLLVVALLLLRTSGRDPGPDDPGADDPGAASRGTASRPAGGATAEVPSAAAGPPVPGAALARGVTPTRAFWFVLGATVVNPTTVVYFVALTTGSATTTLTSPTQRVAFVLAAAVTSAAWQLLLGTAGAWAGRALTGPRGRRWTGRVGALVVLLLAVRTALGG
ncbi:LysE family transporter [Cellulomonas sp. 179-A 9B4 NHS]|uniref:LysE family transporter n=1 Tax=Cellulomonas sp. 179-A 9B4 NHS TaxID=3142379 RepID=UPI0039A19B23